MQILQRKIRIRIFSLLPMLALAALPLAGCRVIDHSAPEQPVRTGVPERQIQLGDRILAGIRDDDFQTVSGLLGNELRDRMTDKDFKTSRENITRQFGRIVGFEYLTSLETPLVENLIWRVTFERQDSKGGTIRQALLFRLVVGEVDGALNVIGFGFL